MVGVVRNKVHKDFACMVGTMNSRPIPTSVRDDRNTVSMAQTSSHSMYPGRMMSFAQTATSLLTSSEAESQPTQLAQTSSGTMRTLGDVPEQTRIEFAQKVNDDSSLTWKANSYSQIEMERLNNRPQFQFAQTKAFGQGSDFREVLAEAQKFI